MRERNRSKIFDKKFRAVLMTLLLLVVLVSTLLTSCSKADSYKAIGNSSIAAPEITASAGLIYCENTDKLVYSKNIDQVKYPYSITKLLTAYLAVDNLELDDMVTISAEPPKREETKIHLQEGERISVKDLLYGLLLPSGNDAACALAEAVAGSEADFARMMTEQATEWGCKNTNFANASGWLDEKHYTTAEDYLIIARKAFGNKTIAKIAATKNYTIPATNLSEARALENRLAKVVGADTGVKRGKTGYWEDYDCSIVFEYDKNELQFIAILLNDTSEGRVADCGKLIDYAQKSIEGYQVAAAGDVVGKVWIKGGEHTHVAVCVDKEVRAYPESGSASRIKTKIIRNDGVKAPLRAGDVVGKLEVYTDGKLTATRKLVLKEELSKGWLPSNLYISNVAVICILIGLVLCVIITRVAHRTIRKHRRRRTQG